MADHHQLTERDRGFNPLPLFHINAEVVGLLSALVAGSCLVLDDRFHRTDFWDLMGERRVTWINAVPAIISRLAKLRPGETVPQGIRFIRSASAPLPVAAADRFRGGTGLPIIETYGMTEAASQITAHPLSVPRRARLCGFAGRASSCASSGRPSRSAARAEAPEFHIGHVEIRGASVIEAYVGATHTDRFRPDGWLRTGDLGHRDADGFVYLVARTDDVINRGGEKILPREVEEVISADDAVASVAVIGQDDPELGQVPVAFVVLRGWTLCDVEEARAACGAARPRRSNGPWCPPAASRAARGGGVAGGCDRQGAPALPDASPVSPSFTPSPAPDGRRVPAGTGPAGSWHAQAARSHRCHAAGQAGRRGVDPHPPLLRARSLPGRGGASLQLLHVTREAFLFVSACMLTYSVRDLPGIDHRTFWRRRFALVAVPYLLWTVIYFFMTIGSDPGTVGGDTSHLLYLVGTGYYQLYYLLVLLEFYALFPLLLILLRRTAGHHGLLLLASGAGAGRARLDHALGPGPRMDDGLLGHA